MRPGAAILLVFAACAVSGCGSSAKDQVRSKVQQFAAATTHKDYATICNQVLAPSLVKRLTSYGIGCERAMRVALGNVQRPTLSIGQITIKGKTASVITLTVAEGQQASLDALQLVDTGDGWRISSLHSPLPS
jgi:hypothetical protein